MIKFNNLGREQKSGSEQRSNELSKNMSKNSVKRNTLHTKRKGLIKCHKSQDMERQPGKNRYSVNHRNECKFNLE